MKQSAYQKARDEKIADDVEQVERHLMCSADGCPRRWSVMGDRGKACSAHYSANPRDWPRITQQLLDAEVDRARYNDAVRPAPEPYTPEQRRAIADRMHGMFDNRADPRAWARELQRRHKAGHRLTQAQVAAYRHALRLDGTGTESEAW